MAGSAEVGRRKNTLLHEGFCSSRFSFAHHLLPSLPLAPFYLSMAKKCYREHLFSVKMPIFARNKF